MPQPLVLANGDDVQIGKSAALQSDRAYGLSVGQPGLARLAAHCEPNLK